MFDSKKERELRILKVFRRLCDDFPSGEIIEDETPDFIIYGDCKLGIEIRQVFLDDGKKRTSLQGVEAARDRIVAEAIKLASGTDLPFAMVAFFPNWTVEIRRERESSIAQRLVKAVRDRMPPVGESTTLRYRIGGPQPIEFDEILVHRGSLATKHDWQWLKADSVEENAIELLNKAIGEKAVLMDRILEKCDACWLLIVANPFRASGKIRPNQQSLSYTYRSPFDRTYFLRLGGPVALSRLQTASPAVAPLG
jgi:hypothetical protein